VGGAFTWWRRLEFEEDSGGRGPPKKWTRGKRKGEDIGPRQTTGSGATKKTQSLRGDVETNGARSKEKIKTQKKKKKGPGHKRKLRQKKKGDFPVKRVRVFRG